MTAARTVGFLAALTLLAFATPALAQSQPGASPAHTAESVRKAVLEDKRGLVEKNMRLTPDEAKRFWPIYDDYQRRLDAIIKRQNRAVLD